jgi:hypothetical protein
MAHDPEPPDPQGIGDAGHLIGRRRQVPTRMRRRSPVAGPVVGHPADAKPSGRREQGFWRRAKVGGAVVPEHRQPGVAAIGQGVVDVQHASVAQPKINLGHHRSSILSDPDRPRSAVLSDLLARRAELFERLGFPDE